MPEGSIPFWCLNKSQNAKRTGTGQSENQTGGRHTSRLDWLRNRRHYSLFRIGENNKSCPIFFGLNFYYFYFYFYFYISPFFFYLNIFLFCLPEDRFSRFVYFLLKFLIRVSSTVHLSNILVTDLFRHAAASQYVNGKQLHPRHKTDIIQNNNNNKKNAPAIDLAVHLKRSPEWSSICIRRFETVSRQKHTRADWLKIPSDSAELTNWSSCCLLFTLLIAERERTKHALDIWANAVNSSDKYEMKEKGKKRREKEKEKKRKSQLTPGTFLAALPYKAAINWPKPSRGTQSSFASDGWLH